MSTWWDPSAGRYRSSLPHRILHVWLWPVIRRAMFTLPSETAHHLAIRGIRLVDRIDRAWGWVVAVPIIAVLLVIRLLVLLPWFTFEPPRDDR